MKSPEMAHWQDPSGLNASVCDIVGVEPPSLVSTPFNECKSSVCDIVDANPPTPVL